MSLVVVRFHVGIMMTYIVFILSVIFVIGFVGFSSKPSPIYGGLVLIVSGGVGCGIIMNFGGSFLGLMVFFNLFGRNVGCFFGYTTAIATEQYPEVWVSNATVMGVFLLGLLMEVMLVLYVLKSEEVGVEKAMIFLMSFWVSAQIAVNSVVIAPRHRVSDWMVLLFSISGWKRISRKTPATTIVLE
uniref:NADH-ubiquinone oxidoreductase chain 6 n=1 Tax=Equus asinus TaxID=9793 RepID=A0A9L0IIX1_EQUAS